MRRLAFSIILGATAGRVATMPKADISTRRILDRLLAEGWIIEGGSKHTKLFHPDRPGIKIMMPRHKIQSIGVGRAIAKDAGWI